MPYRFYLVRWVRSMSRLLSSASMLLVSLHAGQPGEWQPLFGPAGPEVSMPESSDAPLGVQLPDGRWYLVEETGLRRRHADGMIDPTFAAPPAGGVIDRVAAYPDGRVLVAATQEDEGWGLVWLERLLPDGTPDPAWQALPFTRSSPLGDNSSVLQVLDPQPDGTILVAGQFTAVGDQTRTHLARLLEDGFLDESFAPGATGPPINDTVLAVLVEPDGYVIGGRFTQVGDQQVGRLARLHRDGTLDASWGAHAGADGTVRHLLPASASQIWVVGEFGSLGGEPRRFVARLDSAGQLDLTWSLRWHPSPPDVPGELSARQDPGWVPHSLYVAYASLLVNAAWLEPDGSVVLDTGPYRLIGDDGVAGPRRLRGLRLRPDGTVDPTFAFGVPQWQLRVSSTPPHLAAVSSEPQRRIGRITGGGASQLPRVVLPPTPMESTAFGSLRYPNGGLIAAAGESFALMADVVADGPWSAQWLKDGHPLEASARILGTGTTELWIPQVREADNGEYRLQVTSAAGSQVSEPAVLTVRGDRSGLGTIDLDWAPVRFQQSVSRWEGDGAGGGWLALYPREGDRLPPPGNTFVVPESPHVVRLNPDGDRVWAVALPGVAANFRVSALHALPDGRVLVAGQASHNSTAADPVLFRLQGDGTVDTEFESGLRGAVAQLQVDASGRPVVRGWLHSPNGTILPGVVVLHPTGEANPDAPIQLPVGFSPAVMAVRPDGGLWLAGWGSGVFRLLRFGPDGEIVPTVSQILNNVGLNLEMAADDQHVWLVGSFRRDGSSATESIARFAADGTYDSAFASAIAARGPGDLVSFVLGSDGYAYLLGSWSRWAGRVTGPLIRLLPDGGIDPTFPDPRVSRLDSVRIPDPIYDWPPVPPTRLFWSHGRLTMAGQFRGWSRSELARVITAVDTHPELEVLATSGNADLAYGQPHDLAVTLQGTGPFTYSWTKDGELLAGANGPGLHLAFPTSSDAGTYTVTVTGPTGSVSSSFAVAVAEPRPFQVVQQSPVVFAANGTVQALAEAYDGRVLVGGTFTYVSNRLRPLLVRLEADGTLDPTFTSPFSNVTSTQIRGIWRELDGRFLVLGSMQMNGQPVAAVRLTIDGEVEQVVLGSGYAPTHFAPHESGSVVFSRRHPLPRSEATQTWLHRVRADGTIDPDFLDGGAVLHGGGLMALAVDGFGRTYLAGELTAVGPHPVSGRLHRLLPDGTPDPAWTVPANLLETPDRLTVIGDRLHAWRFSVTTPHLANVAGRTASLVRFRADGSLDESWLVARDEVNSIKHVHGAGTGLAVVTGTGVVRLLPNGRTVRAVPTTGWAQAATWTERGLLLAGGEGFSGVNGSPVRQPVWLDLGRHLPVFSETPEPDEYVVNEGDPLLLRAPFGVGSGWTWSWRRGPDFLPGANSDALLLPSVRQEDAGTYFVRATSLGRQQSARMATVTVVPNHGLPGERDLGYTDTVGIHGIVRAYDGPAGSTFLVGSIGRGGTANRPLVAVGGTGALSPGFHLSGRVGGSAHALLALPDGRLLLAGPGLTLDGQVVRLVRLFADGEVDESFGSESKSGLGVSLRRWYPLPDGRSLALFDLSATDSRVLVLSAGGTTEHTVASSLAVDLLPGPEGTFWLVTAPTGAAVPEIRRITADGLVDPNFRVPPRRANENAVGAATTPAGELIVLYRLAPSGAPVRYRMAVVAESGPTGRHIPMGTFAFAGVPSLSLQGDPQGRLHLLGNFSAHDGVARPGWVRLLADGTPDATFAPTVSGAGEISFLPHQRRLWLAGQDRPVIADPADPSGQPMPLALASAVVTINSYHPFTIGLPAWAPPGAQVTWFRDGQRLPGSSGTRLSWHSLPPEAAGSYHARVVAPGGTLVTDPVHLMVTAVEGSGGLAPTNAAFSLDLLPRLAVPRPGGGALVVSSGSVINDEGPFEFFTFDGSGNLERAWTGNGLGAQVSAAVVDSEGRIYLAGSFSMIEGVTRDRVARLLPDGRLDLSWDPGSTASATPDCLALDELGRLWIGGPFTYWAGQSRRYLARLTVDGSLDATWWPDSSLTASPKAIVPTAAGHVWVATDTVLRLLPTGKRDSTFQPGILSGVRDLLAAPDGGVWVGGTFSSAFGTFGPGLARVTPEGQQHPTWRAPSGLGSAYAIAVDTEGALIVWVGNRLARILGDQSLDLGFQAAQNRLGSLTTATQASIVPMANQILVRAAVSGTSVHPRRGFALINTDGNSRPVVAATGSIPPLEVWQGESQTRRFNVFSAEGGIAEFAVVHRDSGRLIASGSVAVQAGVTLPLPQLDLADLTPADSGTYRLTVSINGRSSTIDFAVVVKDWSPPPAAGVPVADWKSPLPLASFGSVWSSVLPAEDGSWWVGGSLGLFRLSADGRQLLDSGEFHPMSGLLKDDTGRLYGWGIGGILFAWDMVVLQRWLPDGTMDPEYVPLTRGSRLSLLMDAAVLHPEGGVIFAGGEEGAGSWTAKPAPALVGLPSRGLFRYLDDGSFDAGFPADGGPGEAQDAHGAGITHLIWQGDNQLLVGGSFRSWGGFPSPGLVRTDASGRRDPSFAATGVQRVHALAVLGDGGVLVAADTDDSSIGLPRASLLLLDAGGRAVSTFRSEWPQDYRIDSILVRRDGHLVVAGRKGADGLVRHLNANGTRRSGGVPDLRTQGGSGPILLSEGPGGRVLVHGPNGLGVVGAPTWRGALLLEGTDATAGRAPQTVDFPTPPDRIFTFDGVPLLATASSGLPVTFQVVSGAAVLRGDDHMELTGTGMVTVRAWQAGDEFFQPAPTVARTFRVHPGPDAWRAANFTFGELSSPLVGDWLADPDGDGRPNLMEYALGSSPFWRAGPPLVGVADGHGMGARFIRPKGGVPGTQIHVETTADWVTWEPITPYLESDSGVHETWRVDLPEGGSVRLLRLRVELLP